MFNPTFSAKNFYDVLCRENRKGVNIEKRFFNESIYEKYTLSIKEINQKLRKPIHVFILEDTNHRKPSAELYTIYKQILRNVKITVKKEKEKVLLELLGGISKQVQHKSFKFNISKIDTDDDPIYTIGNTPANFFAMKHLQYIFHKLYDVKQSNRYHIVNQLKSLLNDKFPKYIIRTDIKKFYESIPSEILLNHLREDNLLTPKAKRLISQVIKDYMVQSDSDKGIPRGIGISAYLSEYYMRKVDYEIQKISNVSYYARYVDDIVVLFTPTNTHSFPDYFASIKEIITSDYSLELNGRKTSKIDLTKNSDKFLVNNKEKSEYPLDYLGYSFNLQNRVKKSTIPTLEVSITESKKDKIKDRIEKSFEAYSMSRDKNNAYRHIKNRIKFLTGNTRLANNKGNVLIGIYFSNMLLTNKDVIKELDLFLTEKIDSTIEKEQHKTKLLKFTFEGGFNNHSFHKFNTVKLSRILKGW